MYNPTTSISILKLNTNFAQIVNTLIFDAWVMDLETFPEKSAGCTWLEYRADRVPGLELFSDRYPTGLAPNYQMFPDFFRQPLFPMIF